MTPLQLTEPWILLCTIFVITSAVLSNGLQIPRSLAPAVPWWQNIQKTPIPVQAKQIPKPVTEISCISSDPNIYKIIEETRDRCKGTDYIVTFYQQKDRRYTKLGSFTVNKYLFHNVLMKYSNWILARDNIDGKGDRKANVDVDKRNDNQKDINNVFKPITSPITSPFRTQEVDTKLPRLNRQNEDSYKYKDPQETKHTYDSTNQGLVEPNIYTELNDNDNTETVFKEENEHRYIEPSYNSKLKGYEVFLPSDSSQQVQSEMINVNIDNVDENNNSLVCDEAIINKIESNPVLVRNLEENTIEVDQIEDIKENIDDKCYVGNLKTEVIDLLINNNTCEFDFEPNKYIDNGIAKKTDNIESDLINTCSTGDTAEYENDVDSYLQDIEYSVSDANIYDHTTYDNNLVYDDELYQHDFLPCSNVENNFYSDSDFNIVPPSEITYNVDKTDDDNVNLPNSLKSSISPSDSTYNKPSIEVEVDYDKIEYNEDLSTAAKYTEHTIPLLPLKSDALKNVEPSQAPPNPQKLVLPVSQISLSMAEPGLVKSTPNFPLPIKSIIPIIYSSPLTLPGVTAQPLYLEPSKSTPLTSSLSIPKTDTYSSQTAGTSPINVNYPTSLPLGKLQLPVVNPKYDLTSFNNNMNIDNYHIATSENAAPTPTTQCNIALSTFINPNIDSDNLPLTLSAKSQPALNSAMYNYVPQGNIVPKLDINIGNQDVPIKTKEFKSLPLYASYLQDNPQLPVANFLSAINMPRKSIPAYAAPAIDVPNVPIPSITKPITSPLQKATEIQVQPVPTPIYEGKFTSIYIQPLSNPITGITPSFSKEPIMNYPLLVNAAEPTSLNTSYYNVPESPLFTISVPSYSDKPLLSVQPLDINHTPFPVNTPEDTTSPISISSQLDVSSLPDVSYNNSPSVLPIQTTPFSEFSSILSSISPQLQSLNKPPPTTTMHQPQVPSLSLPQVKDVNILPLSPVPPMELSLNYLEVPPLPGTNPHQEMSTPLSESPKTLHVTPLLSISSQSSPLSDSLNSLQPNTSPVFNEVIYQPQLPAPNYKPAPISSYSWPNTNLYKLANPLKPFHASPVSPTILEINKSNSPTTSILTPLPRQSYSVLPYISPLYTKNIFQPIPISSLPVSPSKLYATSYLPESPSISDSNSYLPISPTLPYAVFNTRISVTPSASPLTNKLNQPLSYLSNSLQTYSYQPDPPSSYANPCQIKPSSASIASPTAAYTLPLLKSPYAELTSPISYLDPLFSFTSALVKKDVCEPLPNTSPVYIKEISHATLPLMSEIASTAASMPLPATVTPVSSSTDSKLVSSYKLLDSIGSQYLPISGITSSTVAYTSSTDNTIKQPTLFISPQSNKEILQPILQLSTPILPTISSPYSQTVLDNNLSKMKPLSLSISSDTNNLLQWNNIPYNVLTTPNKVLQYNSVPSSVSPLSIAQVQPEKLLPSPYQNTLTSPILTSYSASQLPSLPPDLQSSSLLQLSGKPISSKIVNPFEKLSSPIVLSPENTTVLLKPMSNWPIISNVYPKLYPSRNIMPSLYSDFQPQTKFNWISRLNPAYDIAKPMKYIGLLHDTSSSHNISPTLFSPAKTIPKIPNLQYPRWIPSDNIKIIPQVTRYEPIPLSLRSFKFPSPSDPVQYIDENISKQFSQLQPNVPNSLSPASYLPSPLLPSQSISPILTSASPALLPSTNGLSVLSNTMTAPSSSYISPLVSISSGNTQPMNVQMPLISQNPITLEKVVPILNNKITQTAIPISASFISPLKDSVVFQPSSATSSQPKTISITQPYQWTNLSNKSKFASNIASDIPLNSKLSLNNVLSPMPQPNVQASLPPHYDVVYSNIPTVDASISSSVTSKVTPMLASQSQLSINKLTYHTSFPYLSNQNSNVQTSLPTISPSFNPINTPINFTSQNLVSSIPTQIFASSNQVPSFIPASSAPMSIATLQPTVSIPDIEYISTMPNNLRISSATPISPLSIQPLITPCSSVSTDSNILPFTPTSLQYKSTPLLATVSPVRPMLSAQSTSPLSLTSFPLSLVPPEFSSLDNISPIPIPSIPIRNSIQPSSLKLPQSIPCRYLSNNNPQYISPISLSADTYSSPQTTPIRNTDPSTSQYTQPTSTPSLSISTSSQAKYSDHTLLNYPVQITPFSIPSMGSNLFSKPCSLYPSKTALKPSPLKLQPNTFLHHNPLLPVISSQHLLPHSSVIPWSRTPISHLWPLRPKATIKPFYSTPMTEFASPVPLEKSLYSSVLPQSSVSQLSDIPYSTTSMSVKPIVSPLQPPETSEFLWTQPKSSISSFLSSGIQDVSKYNSKPLVSPLQPLETSKISLIPLMSNLKDMKPQITLPYSPTPIISPLQPSEISKVTVLPPSSPINTLFTALPYSSTPIISPLQPPKISKVTVLPPSSPINSLLTALPYSPTPIIFPLQPSEISKVTVLPPSSPINTLFTALPYSSTPIISPLQPSEISKVTVLPPSSPINSLLTALPYSPTPIISPLQPSEISKVTVLRPNSPINPLLTSGSQITAAFSPKPIVSPLQPPETNQSPLKLASNITPPLDLVSQSSLLVTSPSVLESTNNPLASYTQKYVQSFSPPITKPSLQYARNEQNAITPELTSCSEISTTPSLISAMPCKHTSAIPIAKIQSPIYDTQNIEPTSYISTKTAATYQSSSSSSYLYNNPIYSAAMPSTIYTNTQSQSSKPFTSLYPSPISSVSIHMPVPELSPVSNYIIPYLDKTLNYPFNAINYIPTTSAASKLTDKQPIYTQTAHYTPYSTSYSNLHPSILNYSKPSPRINPEVMSTITSSSAITPIESSSLVYTPKTSYDVLSNPPISSATIPNLPIIPLNVQYSTHIGAEPLELVNTPIRFLKPTKSSVISESITPEYTPLSYNKYRPYQSPLWTSIYSNLPSNLVKPQSKLFYTSQNPSLSDTVLPSSSISSPALNPENVFSHSLIPLYNHNYYNKIRPLLPVTTRPLSTLNTLLSPPTLLNPVDPQSPVLATSNGHVTETSPTLTPLTIATTEKSPQFTTFTSNVKSKAPLNYIESLATPMHYTISSSSETYSNSAQYITPLYTSIAPKELHTLAPLASTEINHSPNPFKYLPTTESPIKSTLSTAPKDVTSSLFTSFYTPAVHKLSPAATEYYSPFSSYQYFNMPQSKFKSLPTNNSESWTTLPSSTFTSLSNQLIASPPSTNIKPIYTTQYKYIPPTKSISPEFTTHYSPNIYKNLPTYSSLLGSKLSPITSPLQYPNLIIPNLPLPNVKLINPDRHLTLSAFYPSISDYHLQEASTETGQLNPYSILPTSLNQSQLQPILTPLQSSQNIPLSLYPSQSSVLYSNLPPIRPCSSPITPGVINTDISNLLPMTAISSYTPLTSSVSIARKPFYSTQYPAYTTTTHHYSSEATPLYSHFASTDSKPSISITSSSYTPMLAKSYSSTSNAALSSQEIPLVSQATTSKVTDIQPTLSKFMSSVSSQLTSSATFHPNQVTPSSSISYTDYTPVTTVSPYSFPTSSPMVTKPSITSNYIPTVAKSIQPLFKPLISHINAKTPTIPSFLLSPLNYNQVPSNPLKSQNILNIEKVSPTSSVSTTPNNYYEYLKPCRYSYLPMPVPINNKFTDVTIPTSDLIAATTIPKLTPISQYLPDSNLKTDLYNYITNNKNLTSNLYKNKDISIPLGNFIITKKNCNNHTTESINSSIGLKVWPSNIKLVKASLQLKCIDVPSTNFEPIVNNISSYDLKEIQNIVANYIRGKYGDVIVVNEKYSLNNEYEVIRNNNMNIDNKYNLLWPANTCSV